MYRYVYQTPRTFLAYRDVATGNTLSAEYLKVYDISGPDPMPPAGFVEVSEEAPEVVTPVADQSQHELDRMTDESGVNHTDSDGE